MYKLTIEIHDCSTLKEICFISLIGNAFLQDSQHLSDKCHDIYSDVAGDINEGVEEAEEEAEEELEEGTEEEEEEEGDGDQGEGQQGEGQGQVGPLVKKALEKHLLQNKLKLMLRKLLQVSNRYIRVTFNEVLLISKVWILFWN